MTRLIGKQKNNKNNTMTTPTDAEFGEAKAATLLHIGRKCPKGYREVSGMHLGKGVWMLRCELETKALFENRAEGRK